MFAWPIPRQGLILQRYLGRFSCRGRLARAWRGRDCLVDNSFLATKVVARLAGETPATRSSVVGLTCRSHRLSAACLTILLGGAAMLGSCSKPSSGGEPARGGAGAAVPITATAATVKPVPLTIETFGLARPEASVAVKPLVTGALTKVHFRKGQDVKKGDLLFTIDPRPYQAALEQAQANLVKDKVQEAYARRDASRDEELVKKRIAAESEYEKNRSTADALAAVVQADQAAVETARLQVEYCTIRSPLDGQAGDLLVAEGNIVKANESTLVTINQVSPIDVFFSVPQGELPSIRQYMAEGKLPVGASVPGQTDCREVGELTFVDNAVDPAAGTIRLGATFANKDRGLWPGAYVNVCLTLTVRKGAVVIPAQCVQTGREGRYVFVVKADKTVEMRPVTLGPQADQECVVEAGVQAGEMVVTDGQFRLTPGAKVRLDHDGAKAGPKPAESAPAASMPAVREDTP